MKKTTPFAALSFIVCLLACSAAATILGEDPGPFAGVTPLETDPSPVRLRIDPDLLFSTVTTGESFSFPVYLEGLDYRPDLATDLPSDYANGNRTPGEGHVHLYASNLDDGELFNTTNVFLGAASFDDSVFAEESLITATVTLPEDGLWLLYAESQYNDHTSRIRWHPQQIGAWDATYVWSESVVPEPAATAMFLLGSLVAFSRGREI